MKQLLDLVQSIGETLLVLAVVMVGALFIVQINNPSVEVVDVRDYILEVLILYTISENAINRGASRQARKGSQKKNLKKSLDI